VEPDGVGERLLERVLVRLGREPALVPRRAVLVTSSDPGASFRAPAIPVRSPGT
jgi:hypothetical protein